MGIYHIITPDNIDNFWVVQRTPSGEIDWTSVPPQVRQQIFFSTDGDLNGDDGISIPYMNQNIEYMNEIDGIDVYTFIPSNTRIEIHYSHIVVQTPYIKISQDIVTQPRNTLEIQRLFVESKINTLKTFLRKLIAKQAGRELSSVAKIPLPDNVISKMAEKISGKKGSLNSQINQLKQNTGISLAPRAGGRRNSRKRN